MVRRIASGIVLLTLVATRAHAQLAVIDPANLVQAVQIAERAQRHYEELQAEYRTILTMAKGLGNMDRYRIPAIAASQHDVGKWLYGQPWLQGLNSGDAAEPPTGRPRSRWSVRDTLPDGLTARPGGRWNGSTPRSRSPTPSPRWVDIRSAHCAASAGCSSAPCRSSKVTS